jgi:hypothetical protein
MSESIVPQQKYIFPSTTIRGDGLVNATALTTAYRSKTGIRKDSAKWLKTQEAKESIAYLERVTQKRVTELVDVEHGVGTWLHPDLAEILAQWISVEYRFAVVALIRQSKQEDQSLRLRREVLALEDKTLSLRHYVVTALPKAQADRILGVTEIKTTEIKEVVVNERGQILGHLPGESYNKKELCERYGIVTRTGKPDYRQINAYLAGLSLPNEAWEDRQVVSHNARLKAEFLPQLDKLIGKVDRQSWIGE